MDLIAGFEAVAARSSGGPLDIMINCAAIVGPTYRNITNVSTAEFDLETAINLRGTVLIAKHAIVARGRGDESSISPPSPVRKEARAMNPYSSSKAGVIGLVKSVGKEYAGTGITVNPIAPAVLRAPTVDGIHTDQMKYMTNKITMKRCGSPDKITALSCRIVSKEASFPTAFTFDPSGGRAVY